jgi:uncharacterized caspase-like protein
LFKDLKAQTLINESATKQNILRTAALIARDISPDDTFVLYLAGQASSLDGKYYFVPSDAHFTSQTSLLQQSLDEGTLRQLLSQIPARKTLLLLDTCNSGSFASSRPTRDVAVSDKAAIEKLAKISGRAILAAAASDQVALEGYMGHGVFTYAFLEGLTKANADKDGVITVSSLAEYIQNLVPQITMDQWKYRQYPLSVIEGQSFSIARKQGKVR